MWKVLGDRWPALGAKAQSETVLIRDQQLCVGVMFQGPASPPVLGPGFCFRIVETIWPWRAPGAVPLPGRGFWSSSCHEAAHVRHRERHSGTGCICPSAVKPVPKACTAHSLLAPHRTEEAAEPPMPRVSRWEDCIWALGRKAGCHPDRWALEGHPLKSTQHARDGTEEQGGAQLLRWPSLSLCQGCVQLPKIFCLSLEVEAEQHSPFNSLGMC